MLARTLNVSTNCNLCGSSSCTVLYGAGVAQLNQIVSAIDVGLCMPVREKKRITEN
jgi:hypothetical protein